MRAWLFTLSLGAILASPRAFPISKVGNSRVGDPILGFSAPIPRSYVFQNETPDNGAVLKGFHNFFDPTRPGSPTQTTSYLIARDFGQDFPLLADHTREDIEDYFQSSDEVLYQKMNSPNPCIDLYLGRSRETDFLIAVWGSQKGAAFASQSGSTTLRALREIAVGIELDPGACAW